jgi:hypothetical protein
MEAKQVSDLTMIPNQAASHAATPGHQEEGAEFISCIGARSCLGWVWKEGSIVGCDHFKDS